jgi:hypothetical protein
VEVLVDLVDEHEPSDEIEGIAIPCLLDDEDEVRDETEEIE